MTPIKTLLLLAGGFLIGYGKVEVGMVLLVVGVATS